jgi:serine/threonine protein kinase
MDRAKAELLFEHLRHAELDGWSIESLIDNGKSAAVFLGKKAGTLGAVKVFDTELIERYGDKAQLARIQRELELRGTNHENLVGIYGGGYNEDLNLHYIIMEYLEGPNLKAYLPEVNLEQVPGLLAQLALAAKSLEDKGLVHRDIKPENILILDNGNRLVLLDFGVIRPIAGSDITDPEGIHAFIGTLQYSSPEFLLREEEQDIDGYRALTFYQIGAVLHDMLTGRPLFEQFENPYGKLVNAVQHERPVIVAPEAPAWLVQLAQRCLLKNPVTRLRMVSWGDFAPRGSSPHASSRDRVQERLATVRAQSDDVSAKTGRQADAEGKIRENVLSQLKLAAMTARGSVAGLPPLKQARCANDQSCIDLNFPANAQAGFPHGLLIRVAVEVVDAAEGVISCGGYAALPKNVPEDGASGVFERWFIGALDNAALHAAFQEFFFNAIDWCLQISPGVTDDYPGVFKFEGGGN